MNRTSNQSRLLLAAGLTLALALPFAAMARPPGGHGGGFEAQIEKLDLDAETQARVDTIFDEARSDGRETKREIRAARTEMYTLLRSGESDEATLVAQAERISALELQMAKRRIATHLQLRTVLNSEQLAQLAAAMPDRASRGKHRRSR